MNVNVKVVPPTEPHIELRLTGLKNFQAERDGFVAQFTVTELKDLWTGITVKLTEAGLPVTTEPLP